ncbi:MAG: serine/threonine-protein kinase [Polyangiaceae bacterium]
MSDGEEDDVVGRARERVGTVLKAKYRLDRVLGAGGMAAVYAATHLRNANRVAVKVLHRELASDEGIKERFLREGYAANSVEHPGTVRILDDDVADDGSVFLVMDLLEGETLDARWERKGRRLKPTEVARLVHQILDVLAAAHAKGVVHRDIKPENLFLTRERLKVLDFGVARLLEGSANKTRAGRVFGTPAYMAPEQVLGKNAEVDAQSDVWAVGATAFTLISGQQVHEAETPEESMVFTATRPARSLATVAPDVPAALAVIVDRALRMQKADRWASAREMQAAIEGMLSSPAESPSSTLPAAPAAAAAPVHATAGDAPSGDTTAVEGSADTKAPVAATDGEPKKAERGNLSIGGIAASQGDAPSAVPYGRRLPPRVLGAAGAAGLLVVGGIVAMVWNRGPAPAASQSAAASTRVEVAPEPAAPQAATAPVKLEDPAVRVEDLPPTPEPSAESAATSPRPAAAAPARASSHAAPAATPAAPARTPGCNPPYTVDATGKKKWKRECL